MSQTMRLAPYKTVGDNLKTLRLAHGLSVAELAARLHVSEAALRHYEDGYTRMPAERLLECATLLDVTIGALFSANPADAALLESAALPPEAAASAP